MAKDTRSLPDVLEIFGWEDTLVMDCNSGLALLAPRSYALALHDDENSEPSGSPKSNATRN